VQDHCHLALDMVRTGHPDLERLLGETDRMHREGQCQGWEELVPAEVHRAFVALAGLKKGRYPGPGLACASVKLLSEPAQQRVPPVGRWLTNLLGLIGGLGAAISRDPAPDSSVGSGCCERQ